MAGIYIHIPYCRQKCHYCNFYSFASRQYRGDFISSLLNEIKMRNDYLGEETISTIYFGGGTPSLLTSAEINRVLVEIQDRFHLEADAEITLEANPDDLDQEKLSALKDTGINRLSIGVQSFYDDDLKYLNRVHSGHQAMASVEQALQQGFHNITIDLIYGIPTLTEEKWNANLQHFCSFGLPHLSAYALTIEPKTALHTLIRKGAMRAVDEKQSIRHFKTLLQKMTGHGYVHYEISNFALEGHYSKHNSIYWVGGHYLGLGPSAHSYNGYSRQWNVSNMKKYVESDTMEKMVEEKEQLTPEQRYNEYVMTSIRTSWGCDSEHIQHVFGNDRRAYFERGAETFIQKGSLRRQGSKYLLTDQGKLFADGIASALFI